MARKSTSSERRDYTPSQENQILNALEKAHRNSQPGAVGRATLSLAKKFDVSPNAVRMKYERLSGWRT